MRYLFLYASLLHYTYIFYLGLVFLFSIDNISKECVLTIRDKIGSFFFFLIGVVRLRAALNMTSRMLYGV